MEGALGVLPAAGHCVTYSTRVKSFHLQMKKQRGADCLRNVPGILPGFPDLSSEHRSAISEYVCSLELARTHSLSISGLISSFLYCKYIHGV